MKLKIITFCLAVTLLVACGNKEKPETKNKANDSSASTQTYVPPVGNNATAQNTPNNVANQQNIGSSPQQPVTMPTKKLTDADIKKLSVILGELQKLNVEAQQIMIKEVQKHGLDVKRFMEIQNALRDPKSPQNYTADEKTKFDQSIVELGKIRNEMQGKMIGILNKQGVTMQDYQKMMIAVQIDQEAQQKLMKLSGAMQPAPAPKK